MPWFRGAWRTATGRIKKALVLDLDDTLWGGTIGDDGVEGIVLGRDHGAKGEAYVAWQQHVAALGQRGVVLAVCSKNAPQVAANGFTHPASALRLSDFATFSCGWQDKATTLRQIADELSLGLDALVFVDDSPAERLQVQQALPDVTVVDIGNDPAQFVDCLEAGHWFDLQSYAAADLQRSAAYAARRDARSAQAATTDLSSYLTSLAMVGQLAPAQASELPRLAQLELKTNQFNLTTRRYTQTQLAAMLERPDHLVLSLRLRDRFGDHGLVASLVAVREADTLRIGGWLMSCRIFSRTAEQFMLAGLVRLGHEQGAAAIEGEYLPTGRNGVVADLYPRLGFARTSPDGRHWRRELALPLEDLTSFIQAG